MAKLSAHGNELLRIELERDIEREARPWQDDVRLIEVIRAERAERERTGNAVSALPLAVGLSAGIWAILWWLA